MSRFGLLFILANVFAAAFACDDCVGDAQELVQIEGGSYEWASGASAGASASVSVSISGSGAGAGAQGTSSISMSRGDSTACTSESCTTTPVCTTGTCTTTPVCTAGTCTTTPGCITGTCTTEVVPPKVVPPQYCMTCPVCPTCQPPPVIVQETCTDCDTGMSSWWQQKLGAKFGSSGVAHSRSRGGRHSSGHGGGRNFWATCGADPLIFDLNKDGDVDAQKGIGIDIDEGVKDGSTNFGGAVDGDGMLVIFPLEEQTYGILDGTSVFGESTYDPFRKEVVKTPNGFEALISVASSAQKANPDMLIIDEDNIYLKTLASALNNVNFGMGFITGNTNKTKDVVLVNSTDIDITTVKRVYQNLTIDDEDLKKFNETGVMYTQSGIYVTSSGATKNVYDIFFKTDDGQVPIDNEVFENSVQALRLMAGGTNITPSDSAASGMVKTSYVVMVVAIVGFLAAL